MVAATRRCTYDGVTEGTNVFTDDVTSGSGDPLDSVAGNATGTALAAAAIKGAKGVRFASTDGQQRYHQFTHATAVTTLADQIYFRIKSDTASSGDVPILSILNSNGPSVTNLVLRSDKSIGVRNLAGTVRDSSGVLPVGTYIAYLCAVRGTTTTNSRIIARVRNFSSGAIVWEYDSSVENLGTTYNLDKVRCGKIGADANTLTDLEIDEFGYVAGTTTEIDFTTGVKQVSAGLTTAAQIGQAVGRRKKKAIGQATTPTPLAPQTKAITQPVSTQIAQPVVGTKATTRIARRIGIYNSDQSLSIAQIQTEMGIGQEAQNYYHLDTEGWSAPVTKFKSWIDLDCAPYVSMAVAKQSTRLEGIANGNAADLDWMDLGITNMQNVAAYGKAHGGVPVYLTLYQEWSVHVNNGDVTGPSATGAVYGEALSVFFEHCDALAPDVKPTIWLAGFNSPTDLENPMLNSVRSNVAPFIYMLTGDPYDNGTGFESMRTTWKSFADRCRVAGGRFNTNYVRLKNAGFPGHLGISEYGIQTSTHTAAQVQTYFGGGTPSNPAVVPGALRNWMELDDYILTVFFNSENTKPHMITSGGGFANPTACTNLGDQIKVARTYKNV